MGVRREVYILVRLNRSVAELECPKLNRVQNLPTFDTEH